MKATRTILPEIERGIPCPFKNHTKKRSLWHDFLRALKPGDSFVIEKRECQNVTHIARQVQVLLVLRNGPDEVSRVPQGSARLWLVPPQPREDTRPEPKATQMPKPPTTAPSTEEMSLI